MNKIFTEIIYWATTTILVSLIMILGFMLYWSSSGKFLNLGYVSLEFKEPIRVLSPEDINLVLSQELKDDLKFFWNNTEDKEYALCVDGWFSLEGENMAERFDEQILILDTHSNFLLGTENYVGVPSCDSMAVLHKHPSSKCQDVLNIADAEGAKQSYEQGISLFLIQCEENMLEVYTRHNLYKGKVIRFD